MASLLLRPILRPQLLAGPIGLGLGLYTYTNLISNRSSPYRLDSGSVLSGGSNTFGNSAYNYTTKAKTPVVTKEGKLNPRAIRQVSLGSITGKSHTTYLSLLHFARDKIVYGVET
jgi:hypothetical protein